MRLISALQENPKQVLKNTAKVAGAIAMAGIGSLCLLAELKNERIHNDAAEAQAFDHLLALAKKTGATRENPGISIEKDGSILVVIVQENGAMRVYRHRGDQLDTRTPAYQKFLQNAVVPTGEIQEK